MALYIPHSFSIWRGFCMSGRKTFGPYCVCILLASQYLSWRVKNFYVLLYPVYIFIHYVILTGEERRMTCPIQFRCFLVCWDPPEGVFVSKVERQRRELRGLFCLSQTILCGKCSSKRILLKIPFKHVFITETRFMIIWGSLIMLYKFCPNRITCFAEYYKQVI